MKKLVLLFTVLLSMTVSAQAEELLWTDLELNQNYVLKGDLVFENGVSVKAGKKYTLVDMLPGGPGFPYMFMEFVDINCAEPELEADHGVLMMKDSNNRNYKVLIKMEKGCYVGMYVHGSKFYDDSIFK